MLRFVFDRTFAPKYVSSYLKEISDTCLAFGAICEVIRSIAHFVFGAKPNKKCDIEMKNKEEFLKTDRSVLVVRDYLAKGL